jgi:hypothetical protein
MTDKFGPSKIPGQAEKISTGSQETAEKLGELKSIRPQPTPGDKIHSAPAGSGGENPFGPGQDGEADPKSIRPQPTRYALILSEAERARLMEVCRTELASCRIGRPGGAAMGPHETEVAGALDALVYAEPVRGDEGHSAPASSDHMTAERARYILTNTLIGGDFRYAFRRPSNVGTFEPKPDGITESEHRYILRIWDTLPGNTSMYDVVQRIAAGNVPK